jgi:PAS domain S-box-containing protein
MKSRFQQLFESSPDPMVAMNRAGQISQANAQAESLFGYGHGQLRGESAKTLFPGQSLTLGRGGSRPAGQSGRHLELVASRRDLTEFPADVVVIPLQTDQGMATVLTVRDLTEAQRYQFVLELGLDVLESADRDKHALLGHLIRAQEEERARIAADIHDDTIQTLSAASLRLQQLRHRLKNAEELAILDKLEEALAMSQSRLRQLIFDLKPSDLDRGSFVSSLRAYLEQMRSETGIAYQLDDGCAARSTGSRNVLIYRTTQEALANVRKHARAKMVRVQFLEVSDGCLARITDDGVGYDPAQIEERPGHIGLTLIRERAQMAGGWSRIESTPGGGTTVEFWVPFDDPPGQPEARRDHAA